MGKCVPPGREAPVLRRLFPACGGLVSSHGVPILYSCVPVPLVIDWFRLMGRIDEDSIRRVLEATDIVDVVGSYLPLKRPVPGGRHAARSTMKRRLPSLWTRVGRILNALAAGKGGLPSLL